MYSTNTLNTGKNKAATMHDPLFNGVNMKVFVEFLTSFYYTFKYLAILMLLETSIWSTARVHSPGRRITET
jgi:hypothetical protein